MRRFVILSLLSAVLVVSAIGMGVARGQLPPAGVVTICSGHGVVTIMIDHEGEPVERQVLCPDCAFGLQAAVPGHAPAGWYISQPTTTDAQTHGFLPSGEARHYRREARGPPDEA